MKGNTRAKTFTLLVIVAITLGLVSCSSQKEGVEEVVVNKPNILWICVEDMNPLFGCYGAVSKTPVVDGLAKEGVMFKRAFAPTAVCSPTRSALNTVMMATTIGAHNHRSYAGESSWIHLPDGIRTIPEMFRDSDYFTFNQHYDGKPGKEDFNFQYSRDALFSAMPNESPAEKSFWREIKAKQPFYGQIQLMGGKGDPPAVDPAFKVEDMKMLPYYPSTPFFKRMYAEHHMQAERTDREVGNIIQALKANGLLPNTVVFFFTDHGWKDGIRHKQFCYDGGLHVPLVVNWEANPDAIRSGIPRNDLVSLIDVSATSLALAGIPVPDHMEGRDLFSKNFSPRNFVIGNRDRMDWTIDHMRTVRTDRYRYIRNYLPDRPYLQPQYRDTHPFMMEIKKLYREGKLNEVQSRFFAKVKPAEEFYDLRNDPFEINNLINESIYFGDIKHHRQILHDWIRESDDRGQYPESAAALAAIYEKWGEKCVNPEYDAVKQRQVVKK